MNNLGFGLEMTVLGMGSVFLLLALLWAVLALLIRLDRPPAQQPAAPDVGETTSTPAVLPMVQIAADGLDADLIAAITIAVLTHREVRRKQAAPAMRSYWPGSLLYASRWVANGRAMQNQSWRRR